MPEIANTPKPPYYAVIFSNHRTDGVNGYAEMAERMADLATQLSGHGIRPGGAGNYGVLLGKP